ncbi:MAG: hypothetical protein WDN31_07710 [Hyphomicrobium sp.]
MRSMLVRSAFESPSGGLTEGTAAASLALLRTIAGTRICAPASSRALASARLLLMRTCPVRSSFWR